MLPFQKDESQTGFSYTDQLASEQVILLHVREAPGGISVSTDSPLNPAEQAEVSQKFTWMLGLEQDFSTFYALAETEPKLKKAAAQAKGRILRSPTLFEDVVKTILTTNTLWAATIRMNRNLVEQFGAPLPSDPSRRAFARPGRLAAASEEKLRADTRLGYRAPFILELARRVDSGELDLEGLKTAGLPTLELRKQLRQIKGIGDYAAANLLMILGRYDFIPVDSWALKMVSREWHAGGPVSRAEVEAAFARWGDWKGLAYWMWNWENPTP
jgi:3-methyladenine DNA glycosylase/8-oxoguanine DNA glycosylase